MATSLQSYWLKGGSGRGFGCGRGQWWVEAVPVSWLKGGGAYWGRGHVWEELLEGAWSV